MNEIVQPDRTKMIPGAPIADLGDGLLLRHARPEDAEALGSFNADVHRNSEDDPLDEFVGAWTRDLLQRPHPTVAPELFTVVEDTTNGAIASTLNLIPQTWTYGGIPFGVGRVELVATAKEYRRQGLVRRQMEEVHRWSADMGHLLQAITGIPWYYRQFGYEMCLNLGGGRRHSLDDVPALPEGDRERFSVRRATLDDVPFLTATDDSAHSRSLIACGRDTALWRYEVEDPPSHNSLAASPVLIVESTDHQPVGFVVTANALWDRSFAINTLEIASGASWLAIMPSLLRWAKQEGERQAGSEQKTLKEILFSLGDDHPAYPVLGSKAVMTGRPYAWFIRVPDLPAFLKQVQPVLERNLAASPASGFTGDLNLFFFQSGLTITFEAGIISAITPRTDLDRRKSATFPGLTFLQVLTGWRSVQEVEYAFPDCRLDDTTRLLADSLFPKQSSFVWPVS